MHLEKLEEMSMWEMAQSFLVKKDTIFAYANSTNDIFKVQKQPASSNNAAQIEIT